MVGIVLAIQGLVLYRRQEWKAVFALCTVASVLLSLFMVLCRLDILRP